MNNHSITRILRETSLLLEHKYDQDALRFVEINTRDYFVEDFNEFRNDLFEAGNKIKLLFMEQYVSENNLESFVKASGTKVVAFKKNDEELHPCLLSFEKGRLSREAVDETDIANLPYFTDNSGNVVTLVPYPYTSLVSEYSYEGDAAPESLTVIVPLIGWRSLTGMIGKARLA